jgi:hypothetical protein
MYGHSLLVDSVFSWVCRFIVMEMDGLKLVAHLLAMAALWVRIQRSLKNKKMGDISKGVANTL